MLCHRTIRSQAVDLVWHSRFPYRNDEPLVVLADTNSRQRVYPHNRQCLSRSFASHAHSPWTPEEKQELVALRKRGVKWSQMKFYLEGRSTRAIMAHFQIISRGDGPLAREARDLTRKHRKGVPLVTEDVQMAVQLHAEGLTAKQIDERIGKGHGVLRIGEFVRDPAQFLNPRRETRFTPQEDTLLVQLASKKLRWSEIAKHFPSKAVRTLQSRWLIYQPKTPSGPRDKKIEMKVFTREETEKLLNMYKQGLTTNAIAETLECRSDQVRWKLYSHGLVKRGFTYVDVEGANQVLRSLKTQDRDASQRVTVDQGNQIREMSRSGMSVPQIALALHRNTKVVEYWLRNDGNPRPNAWTHEEETKVQEFYDNGKDAAQIAKEVGRTKSSIEAKLHVIRTKRNGESPMSHKLPWTPQEESRLVELYLEGRPTIAIGDQLGRMPRGVEGKIVQMRKSGRIPPRRPGLLPSSDTSATAVA